MESRAREGLRSGASLFKELRSSLRGAAGLPGFRDAQSQDALSSCAHLPTARDARERSPEESMRGRGLELPQGSCVLLALSTESRGEIQGGRRTNRPLSPGHHVPFALRPLASCRSRGGRLPEQGGSVCLWQFFPRCGILPHCFSGEAMT